MEELEEFSQKEESNFDLKAELYKYLAYWKWLVFGCLLGLFIAYLYNRYTIPAYATEATMMILDERDNNVVGALPSGGASILSIGEAGLQNQIVALKSKNLVEEVIDALNLNVFYYLEGKVITVEAYEDSPVKIEFLSPEQVVHDSHLDVVVTPRAANSYLLTEEESGYSKVHEYGVPVELDGLSFIISPTNEREEWSAPVNIILRPLSEVANEFIYRMTIQPKGQALDILSLIIVGEVPEKSQDFLNSLMLHFNANEVADKKLVAENTAKFIQERLELISEELDSVEGGIAEFKRENQIMDVGSSAGQYLAKSAGAEQALFDLETQMMILNSVEDELRSAQKYDLLPSNMGVADAGVSGQIDAYNQLVMERNAFLNSATPENPTVMVLTERLNALKQNLLENIAAAERSMEIQLREFNELDQMAEGRFSTFPGLEKGMRNIVRQQAIKEQLYLFLLQRREESAIASAATAPAAKIVDPAFTYYEPVDPKPGLILAAGGLAGFLVPLLIIFTINFLDTKIHHKGDLQPLAKEVPFLGEVPRVGKEQEEIIRVNDRSPLAESFRILRTNLAYMVQSRNRERAEVIFVTSTIKGEGKTFISYNLARTLASTGKKILLIGADVRNPKLHKYAGGTVDAKGLSDYLHDFEVEPQTIINRDLQEDITIDITFSGAIPPNPAELLMNDRMSQFVRSQEKNYDFIIVDTAPTMIVTDTLLISPLADTTIYVTRAGFTEKKLLDFPKDLKAQGKLKGLAIVLNDVDYSKFSYGAKYGYAYGYGYGYGADEENTGFFSRWKEKISRRS